MMDDSIDPRLRGAEQQQQQPQQQPSSIVTSDGTALNTASQQQPADAAPTVPPTTAATTGPSPTTTGPPAHSYGGSPTTPATTSHHPSYAATGDTSFDGHHDATPGDPNDPKRPRACEACRGLKVKCEPEPSDVDGPCKRCRKANRACVITQPTRKRQKKTDSRVAELEKKIDALTASLQASRGGSGPSQPSVAEHNGGYSNAQQQIASLSREWHQAQTPSRQPQTHYAPEQEKQQAYLPPMITPGQKRKHAETTESSSDEGKVWPQPPPPNRSEDAPDIIDRGLMTMQQADEFFSRYIDHMLKHLPAVVFPPGTTAAELRKTKPILFLAVMAAASSEIPHIQRQVVKELVQIFADKIVIVGEKSLELVQALQVGVIWYHPPEHFEELKFYQLVHMGAVMAIDIGLGRKRSSSKQRMIPYTWRDHPMRKNPLPDPSSIESRRAWLSCYFLASNVAMALHRPNLIRWAPFMTECIDILESSPEAAPTDKYLCHLVWSHRLAEEVGIQFSMDDPTMFVNVAEPKVQYALRGFERDLEKYSESIPKAQKQPSLLLSFHVLNLYMHEIALYVEKGDDIRPPYTAEALRDPVPGLNESLTPAHIGALSSCLTAIDGIFETFLSMNVYSIRCLPVFNFVRVAYAVVVLIKMYFSASMPNSELGKVINKDNMKVEEYLEKLLAKFGDVAASDKSPPAAKFIVVLAMLRSWFQKQGKADNGAPTSAQQNSKNSDSESKMDSHTSASTQQQPQAHSEYNPANTPLQLLSEIATGNRGTEQNSAIANANLTAQTFQNNWMSGVVQPTQPFLFDPGNMAGPVPYLNDSFSTADFDYTNLGDGFEQAMGLTFGGLITPGLGSQGMDFLSDTAPDISGQQFSYQ